MQPSHYFESCYLLNIGTHGIVPIMSFPELLSFPTEATAEEAVATLLRFIGEDTGRDGLLDTPSRVVRAWREMTSGYGDDPAEILSRTFEESSDEMIVLRGITFYSVCEHHLLPFYGTASVGYLPGRVVGISKLARVLEAYARRLQIQEKLTAQVANTIQEVLQPRGVGVIVDAAHQCMTTRGVHKPGMSMVTSRMLGSFRTDPSTRREFLAIVGSPTTAQLPNL